MGFAPNNIFYKSPPSIGLENQESTPNDKKKNFKNGFQTRKRETQNNPNMQFKCHPCIALIPIDEILKDIRSDVDIKACIKWQ